MYSQPASAKDGLLISVLDAHVLGTVQAMTRLSIVDLELLAELRAACRSGEVKQLRMEDGTSQSELAAYCGCSAAAISRWEDGNRIARGRPALRYARWFASRRDAAPAVNE